MASDRRRQAFQFLHEQGWTYANGAVKAEVTGNSLVDLLLTWNRLSPPQQPEGAQAVAWVVRCDGYPAYGLVRTQEAADRYIKNIVAYAAKEYTNLEALPLIVDPMWEKTNAR